MNETTRKTIQEAIDSVNGFESNLVQPNITQFKTYFTDVPLSMIPETVDITEFLHKMLEKSQQFTSNKIKLKLFTLTDSHIEIKVEYETSYSRLELPNSIFYIPDQWDWEDLIGIVDKD